MYGETSAHSLVRKIFLKGPSIKTALRYACIYMMHACARTRVMPRQYSQIRFSLKNEKLRKRKRKEGGREEKAPAAAFATRTLCLAKSARYFPRLSRGKAPASFRKRKTGYKIKKGRRATKVG